MEKIKNLQISGSEGKPILLDISFNKKMVQPVVVYAHGFNGFKDWGNFDRIADQFIAAGFAFVKFNFSHNGTSVEHPEDFVDLEAFGNNNYSKQLDDIEKVIDWVSDKDNPYAQYFYQDSIGLIGHSMGGGISILHAAKDQRVKALITWAAISECKTPWGSWSDEKIKEWKKTGVQYYQNGRTHQQMPLYYQLYEDYQQHSEQLDILHAATQIRIPWLICHGTKDTSVSIEKAGALHRANPSSELFTLPTDHVFDRKHPWTENFLPKPMQQVLDRNIMFFREVFETQ